MGLRRFVEKTGSLWAANGDQQQYKYMKDASPHHYVKENPLLDFSRSISFQSAVAPEGEEGFWSRWGLAIMLGIGALVLASIIFVYRRLQEQPLKEGATKEPAQQVSSTSGQELEQGKTPETQDADDPATDGSNASPAEQPLLREGTLQNLVQIASLASRVGAFVAPKMAKGQALRGIMSKRLVGAKTRAENMLMTEVEGMAAEVCEVIDAPEVMLLKDWDSATSSFPPLPGLVSGLIAPLRLQANLWANIIHIVGIVPIIALCTWALIDDWSLLCKPIPSLRWWAIATLWIGGFLVLARIWLMIKVLRGLKTLQTKADEMHSRSLMRVSESGVEGGDLHIREIQDILVDHSVLANHALKIDANINASIFNLIIGVTTVLWVACIFWNMWLALAYSFVPGEVAFSEAARASANFCAQWHIVFVGRIVAVLSVLLLLFNLNSIFMWILGYVMANDTIASKIHSATRTFDRNTTGLPVCQLLVRLCIMPSTELDEVRLHHVRQKYLTTEEDLRHTEKNVKKLQQRREKQLAKLEKLEAIAAEKAKSGKNKDPVDQTLEEIEHALRNTFNPEMWHQQGLDAVRKAKAGAPADEGGASPEQPKTESIERLFADISQLASRVGESDEFKKASEVAQSAASAGAEQAQKVLTQAQQMDIDQLRQEALDKGKVAHGAMSSAMEQAQQSEAFQKASDAAKQAQDAASSALAKGSKKGSSGSKRSPQ